MVSRLQALPDPSSTIVDRLRRRFAPNRLTPQRDEAPTKPERLESVSTGARSAYSSG